MGSRHSGSIQKRRTRIQLVKKSPDPFGKKFTDPTNRNRIPSPGLLLNCCPSLSLSPHFTVWVHSQPGGSGGEKDRMPIPGPLDPIQAGWCLDAGRAHGPLAPPQGRIQEFLFLFSYYFLSYPISMRVKASFNPCVPVAREIEQ